MGMMTIGTLRQITVKDEAAYLEYIQEWYDLNEVIVPNNTDLKKYSSFNDMVKELNQSCVQEGKVPSTTLFLFENQTIKGAIDIRHELNARLQNIGGHVGYGVRPSQRGKGLATSMLEYALTFLKEKDVDPILMTCNPKNIESQQVMLKKGGYEIEPYIKKNGNLVKRYHIPNK